MADHHATDRSASLAACPRAARQQERRAVQLTRHDALPSAHAAESEVREAAGVQAFAPLLQERKQVDQPDRENWVIWATGAKPSRR
jgi:hypothetical protein